MAPPRLHLDADTPMKALHTALVSRGHAVTRTPNAWIVHEASDTEQRIFISNTVPGQPATPPFQVLTLVSTRPRDAGIRKEEAGREGMCWPLGDR